MQKVIGLLIQKGFKTFSQAVGQTARMLRDNGAGDHVEKITPRQWKAAYQFAADMPGVEGAESEESVAALSADKVQAIVSGHVDKAKAEAEARTDTNPSDAQKEAENYRKGKFSWNGQTIAVENPKGSERTGKGEDGAEWRTVMPATYGYFLGTVGADKDHVDVFMGDTLDAPSFWVINQTQPDSATFDEHKVVAGVTSADEAKRIYLDSFSDGFGDKVFSSIAGPYPVGELADVLPKLKAKKPFGVGSFLDGASPMQAGKLKASLAKQYRFDGEVMTVQERVESLHKSGNLQVSSFEEPKIKPMSRTQFNRADNREQAAHERKMREAGNKTVYLVGESDIGKTAHDYAKHLLAGGAMLSDAKAEESPRDAHIRAKEEAYAARREGQAVPPKALEIVRTEAGKEFDRNQAELVRPNPLDVPNDDVVRASDSAVDALPEEEAKAVAIRLGKKPGKDPYATIKAEHPDDIARAIAGDTWSNGQWVSAQQPTHQDPGQPAEAVTPAVVAKAVQKSARNTEFNPDEAKKWLLGEIDKAVANVPAENAELGVELARYKSAAYEKETTRQFGVKEFKARRNSNIDRLSKQIGFVTFDVPGDGKFKVMNTVDGLNAFRKKVEASPGFKTPSRSRSAGPSLAAGPGLDQSIADAKKFGGSVLAEIGNAIEISRLRGKEDDTLLDRFKENSGGKSYDEWRAEQEAAEEIAAREEAERGRQPSEEEVAPAADPNPEPNPLDFTPKQYHEARMKWVAQEYGLSDAEVRQDYDTPAARDADNQAWVDAVRQAFKDGTELTRATLDKLEELRPGAFLSNLHDYPDANVPDGYQTPSARKAEKEAADAKRETRSEVAQPSDLTNIFAGLSSRGLAKSRAQKAAEAHPRAAQIAYVQDNFMDILTELEDSGLVKINCD